MNPSSPARPAAPFEIRPIGQIRTGHLDRAATPVQATLNPTEHGEVELAPVYRDGLLGLEGFDHAWLVTWLAAASGRPAPPPAMRQVPFLLTATPRPIGLFAMRGPRRPNPIGLHLVRIVDVTANGFTFAGVDMVDRTPLLDVKPWVAALDLPPGRCLDAPVRSGWFDTVDLSAAHTPASLRSRP